MIAEGGIPPVNLLDYQLWASPDHANGAPSLLDQRESGRFIVSRTASDTWAVNERFGHLGLGEPLAIPQTSFSVPQDLWSLDAGASYNHHLANGRDFGLNFGIGSDSDHPFYSMHETVFRAGLNYRVPSGDKNAWLFFLNYSNNRHFLNNVPLPGFGYFFKADEDKLQGIVGFPLYRCFTVRCRSGTPRFQFLARGMSTLKSAAKSSDTCALMRRFNGARRNG